MTTHAAICARCPERALCRKLRQPGATCEHWPAAPPGIPTLATRLITETGRWLLKGAPVAPPDVRAARLAICQVCPHWDPAAFANTGRCQHPACGCSKAKHLYATSRCPMGQWEAVSPSDTTTPQQ